MSTTVGCYALCIKESSYIMANSTKEDVPGALLNGRKSKTGCQIEIVTGVSLMTRPCELPSNKRVRGMHMYCLHAILYRKALSILDLHCCVYFEQ